MVVFRIIVLSSTGSLNLQRIEENMRYEFAVQAKEMTGGCSRKATSSTKYTECTGTCKTLALPPAKTEMRKTEPNSISGLTQADNRIPNNMSLAK